MLNTENKPQRKKKRRAGTPEKKPTKLKQITVRNEFLKHIKAATLTSYSGNDRGSERLLLGEYSYENAGELGETLANYFQKPENFTPLRELLEGTLKVSLAAKGRKQKSMTGKGKKKGGGKQLQKHGRVNPFIDDEAQCDDGSDGSSEEEEDGGSNEPFITHSSDPGFNPDVHLPRRSNVDETLTNPNNDIDEDKFHSDGGETSGGDSTYSLSSETRRGEEDDVTGSEEHLSEYFLAIQKVLHDIAAKLTNTHHLICHKTVKGQGKTYLPPNPSRTADANGGKPKDGEVSSEGRESGGGDGEGGDVSSSE